MHLGTYERSPVSMCAAWFIKCVVPARVFVLYDLKVLEFLYVICVLVVRWVPRSRWVPWVLLVLWSAWLGPMVQCVPWVLCNR